MRRAIGFGVNQFRRQGRQIFILSFALLSFAGCSDSRPRITERDGLAPIRTRDPVAMAIDRGINRDRPDLFPHGVVEARGVPATSGGLPGNWSRGGANSGAGSSIPGTTQNPGSGSSNAGGAQAGSTPPSLPRPRPRRAILPERDELMAFCEANRTEDQRWRSSHYSALRACVEQEGFRFSSEDWGRIHRRSLNSSNAEAKRLLTRRGWPALTYSITAVERLYSARPVENMDRELEDLIHGGFQAEDDSPCAQGYFSRFYRELLKRVDPHLGVLEVESASGGPAQSTQNSTQTSSLLPEESRPNELSIEIRQGGSPSESPQPQPISSSLSFGRIALRDLTSSGLQDIARRIEDLVSSGRTVSISGWLLDFRVGSSADVSPESISNLRRVLTQVGILARPAATVPGPEGMVSSASTLSISTPRTVPVIIFVSEQTQGISEILALELKGLEKILLVGAARTQGYARSGICTRSCELPGVANPVRIRTACRILSTPDGRTSDGHPVLSEIFLSVRAQNSPSVILDWLEQLARGRTPGDWPLRRSSVGAN
jgi:hypothetical protein